jgi:arylsulfatase A-like enzyme
LLKKLADLGLETNTLVIFTSDNGGTGPSLNEPLRGAKGGYYEGGIREPFLVRWPGVVKPGTRCDTPIINVDLYPTFVVLSGGTPAADLDGESLLPLFKGGTTLKRETLFWHFPGYLDNPVPRGRDPVFRTRPVSVIRKGDWKLHLYHEEWLLDGGRDALATNRAIELYNVVRDIGERTDLAPKEPKKRDELLDDLLAWINRTQAPMPGLPNQR